MRTYTMRRLWSCLLTGVAVGTTACGSGTDRQSEAPAAVRFSRAQIDSIAATQRPLIDSARASVARAEFRSPTLLAFGFKPDPVRDSLVRWEPGPTWDADARLALGQLARDLGVRFVASWHRPPRVVDRTTNSIYDLRLERAPAGVLLLRPGAAPTVVSSDTPLDSVRHLAGEMFAPGRGSVPRA